jgi:hypothetical protein
MARKQRSFGRLDTPYKKSKKVEVPLLKYICRAIERGEIVPLRMSLILHANQGFHINKPGYYSTEVYAASQRSVRVRDYYKNLIKNIKYIPGAINITDIVDHERPLETYHGLLTSGRFANAKAAGMDSYYTFKTYLDYDPSQIIREGLASLNIKNIKVDRLDTTEAYKLNAKALSKLIGGLLNLYLDALNIGNVPRELELLVKDSQNKIIYDEALSARLLKDFISETFELIESTIPLLEVRFKLGTNNDPTDDQDYLNLKDNFNNKLIKLYKLRQEINTNNNASYHMTRATEYDPSDIDKAMATLNTSYKEQFGEYSKVLRSAIATKELIKNNVHLATENELMSIIRAEQIFFFNSSIIYGIYAGLQIIYSSIDSPQPIDPINYKSLAYTIVNMLCCLKAAGVTNTKIEEVFDTAFSVYEEDKKSRSLEGESDAFRVFLNKVAIPLDIAGLNSAPYDKEISDRLKSLGKLLASKHGVTYASSPGNTAVDAMRRAEDIDDVMLDITEAVQDCFDIINSEEEL